VAPALLVALVAFSVYAFGLAPGPYLLDAAEFATAGFTWGVAHPPGQPLALLFGKLFTLLPLGSVAFRVGLSQAFAGAMAAALVFLLSRQVIATAAQNRGLGPRGHDALAASAALAFALAPGAIGAATRPEVYALATALALVVLLCALRATDGREPRWALVAALAMGLSLGNHPLIAGAAGVGAVLAALPLLGRTASWSRVRLAFLSLWTLAMGTLVIVYIPARAFALAAGSTSTLSWGDARTWGGLWWVLSARTFVDKAPIVHRSADPVSAPLMLIDELSAPLAILALGAGYVFLRERQGKWPPVVVAGLGAFAAALVGGLDPGNPDIRGYLGVTLATAPVLAAGTLAFLLRRAVADNRAKALASLCVLAVVMVRGAFTMTGLNAAGAGGSVPLLTGVRAAERVTATGLADLPPSTYLFTGHFETAFLLAYQQGVELSRPDVTWVHLGFSRSPGYAARLSRHRPELGPVFAAHAGGAFALAPLLPLARRGGVFLEPDGDLAPALVSRLRPAGAWWRVATSDDEDIAPWPAADDPSRRSLGPAFAAQALRESNRHREVLGFVAWRLFLDARVACAAGDPHAPLYVDRLLARVPDDLTARALSRACLNPTDNARPGAP
jgi:hypothetical protein